MKLTEIAIERYRECCQTRLALTQGLNVVFSSSQETRFILRDFVTSVLYGPAATMQAEAGYDIEWPAGYLGINSGGQEYRLARSRAAGSGQLVISDLSGTQLGHRTPDLLAQLDRSDYESFFCLDLDADSWSPTALAAQMVSRFDINTRPTNFQLNPAAHDSWRNEADRRRSRLEFVRQELNRLGDERQSLQAQLERLQVQNCEGRSTLECELDDLEVDMGRLSARLYGQRDNRTRLQQEIAELAQRIEQLERQPRHDNRTALADNVAFLYERLDEIENHLGLWRHLQTEIQKQRVRLRDDLVANQELNIDSTDHPYHQAKNLLLALEDKLDRTEQIANQGTNDSEMADEMQTMVELCSQMRDDLMALCQDLGQQYKHVRHKAVVAELKQLRRCYHEMDEMVDRLLSRRESVIDEIRQLDPAGFPTRAGRRNRQFYSATERHDLPSDEQAENVDLSKHRARLSELQRQCHDLDRVMATIDMELQQARARRSALLDEQSKRTDDSLHAVSNRLRINELKMADLHAESAQLSQQIEQGQLNRTWKPDYLVNNASRLLRELSDGRFEQLWITADNEVQIQQADGPVLPIHSVENPHKELVRLSLVMAAAGQFALRGIRFPLVVLDTGQQPWEDMGHGLSDPTIRLLQTLETFCRNGHQVMLVTGNRRLLDQARFQNTAVIELADTEITSPTWYPDRPSFPRTEFRHESAAEQKRLYGKRTFRPVDYHADSNIFEKTPVLTLRPFQFDAERGNERSRTHSEYDTRVDHNVNLQDIDLVESIYLSALESIGIRTVGQLLDLDFEALDADIARRGFNREQIQRWQSQARMLICLPDLAPSEARILIASGIDDPESLLEFDADEIHERIHAFLGTPAGRRSNAGRPRIDMGRIGGWLRHVRDFPPQRDDGRRPYRRPRVSGARQENGYSVKSLPGEHRSADSRRNRRGANAARGAEPVLPRDDYEAYQFFLDEADDISAAPSIGSKTAERMHRIGIRTVSDLLHGSPKDISSRVDNRRMSAKTIEQWQKQSYLMCRVPNLRGHDAQILVACGICEPEQLAAMDADTLLGIVGPFSKTKEGGRILRTGKKPDRNEVSEWIDAAAHCRELHAA